MAVHNKHIIRHQFLDMQFNGSEAGGFLFQQRLADLTQETLPPIMEKSLDEINIENQYISIDRLEIDLGDMQLNRFEQDFVQLFLKELKEKLRHQIHHSSEQAGKVNTLKSRITMQEFGLEALIHFLEYGYLPWNVHLDRNESLGSFISKHWNSQVVRESYLARLYSILLQLVAQRRFLQQFSPVFVNQVLQLLLPKEEVSFFSSIPNADKIVALKNLLKPNLNKHITSLVAKPAIEIPPERESIYIENSGLILLHPFLPRLFEGLHILKEGQIEDPDRAMTILHYLCTGQTTAPEYELVLSKILCGIPIGSTMSSQPALTSVDQEEADALLQAVIQHWTALRSTSPDGLRSSFLQRPGKLTMQEEGNWILQVESRTYDILLDQMPWGFTRIQLAWMPAMILAEWGSNRFN